MDTSYFAQKTRLRNVWQTIKLMASFNWDLELYNRWGNYLVSEWGLDPEFAKYPAAAQTWIQQTGGHAVLITSGYRSPKRQYQLQQKWDAGNRKGLVTRPATYSWHMQRRAIDVSTRGLDFNRFRDAMVQWGCRWGGNFKAYDPVHFDLPKGKPLSINQLLINGNYT